MSDSIASLSRSFQNGTPQKPDGFYRGTLLQLLPKTPAEQLGTLLSHLFLPWKGKQFFLKQQRGINILPSFVSPFLSLLFPRAMETKDSHGVSAFPFQTREVKGIQDAIPVIRLDYNQSSNPRRVKQVIDEIVSIDTDTFLGKAFLVEKDTPRLVAFFRLTR